MAQNGSTTPPPSDPATPPGGGGGGGAAGGGYGAGSGHGGGYGSGAYGNGGNGGNGHGGSAGGGSGHDGYGPGPSAPYGGPRSGFAGRGTRFFDWMRGLGIVRADGWLGGVCAGIAYRLGIDPLIVRGIVVVAALLGAPVLLLYAAAWALLPDRDGRIHLQRLFDGDVQPPIVAIGVLLILSLLPWTGGLWWAGAPFWHDPGWGDIVGRIFWTLVVVGAVIAFVAVAVRRSGPGGAAPGSATAGGTAPGGTYPGGTYPGGTNPGGATPGGTYPGGATPGATHPDGTTPGGTYPGGTTPGSTYPGGTTPGGTYPGGTTPGATYPGGTNPGGTSPAGTYPGATPPGGTPSGDGTSTAFPASSASGTEAPTSSPTADTPHPSASTSAAAGVAAASAFSVSPSGEVRTDTASSAASSEPRLDMSAEPSAPPAPSAGASPEDVADWQARQAQWKAEHAQWKQRLAEDMRTVKAQRSAEIKAQAAAATADAAARRAAYRASNPRVGAAIGWLTIGVALVAGALASAFWTPVTGLPGYSLTASFAAATAVFGLAALIAGIARRRSGGLITLGIILAVLTAGTALLPHDPLRVNGETVVMGGDVHLEPAGSADYVQPWGSTTITLDDAASAPGTPTIDLTKGPGPTTLFLPEDATLHLEAATPSSVTVITADGAEEHHDCTPARTGCTIGAGDSGRADVTVRIAQVSEVVVQRTRG